MLKNILVPLDGSPLAEAALPYAQVIASRTGATLTLVRSAHASALLADMATDQYRAIREAEEYLETLSEDMCSQGIQVQTAVPFGASPAAWILEESEARNADLIVMATHDRVGPDRWVHGSVAEAVVHRSTVPVMLVRAADADQLAQRFTAQQPVLIVPLDGSELAESALKFASELAQVAAARVVLLGVMPKPGQLVAGQGGAIVTYVGPEHGRLEAEAREYLESAAARVGGTAETVVRYGDASAEIAAAAQDYGAAAVVMATHDRTGLFRSVIGSVAGSVLHHSSSPVVLIRSAGVGSTEQQPGSEQTATAPAG